jgi:hypothetical protein
MLFRTEYSLGFLKCFKRASLFAAAIIVSALIITVPKVVFRVFIEAPWVAFVLDFRNVSTILLAVFIAASKAASVTASVIVRVSVVVVG